MPKTSKMRPKRTQNGAKIEPRLSQKSTWNPSRPKTRKYQIRAVFTTFQACQSLQNPPLGEPLGTQSEPKYTKNEPTLKKQTKCLTFLNLKRFNVY